MKIFKTKSNYAINELDTDKYRQDISHYVKNLHKSADELDEKQKEYLINNGYNEIDIDDVLLLIPEDMSFQELYSSLQNMPNPEDKQKDFALYYFVNTEDMQEARKSKIYQDVVRKRENILNNIHDVYVDFWSQEVKKHANTEKEQIIYLLAGLNKDINAELVSDITGVEKSTCKKYRLNDDGFVIKS